MTTLSRAPNPPQTQPPTSPSDLAQESPSESQRWSLLRPILWVLVWLTLMEIGLEVRAARRGYRTPLASWHSALTATDAALATPGEAQYGPTPDFPFRSRILAPAKSAGARRIWIVSASHADDTGVPAAENFVSRLDDRLRAAGRRNDETMNVSRIGNTLSLSNRALAQYHTAWQPDVVVLYQMATDISRISRQQDQQQSLTSDAAQHAPQPLAPNSADADFATRLVESTTAYELLKNNVTSWISQQRMLPTDIGEGGAKAYEQSVREFLKAVRQRGSEPVLCTFATSHNRRNLARISNDVRAGTLRHTPTLAMEGWINAVERCNAVLRRIAAEENVQLIDLQQHLDGRPEYFRDFVHFSPAGHERLAEVLFQELSPRTASALGSRPAP